MINILRCIRPTPINVEYVEGSKDIIKSSKDIASVVRKLQSVPICLSPTYLKFLKRFIYIAFKIESSAGHTLTSKTFIDIIG